MIKLIVRFYKYWQTLPFDSDVKEVSEKGYFSLRDKPLTWKQVFFRDKKAIISNVFFPLGLIILGLTINFLT